MKQETKVTQADREAAWPFRDKAEFPAHMKGAWMAGVFDDCTPITEFARHRLASTEAADALLAFGEVVISEMRGKADHAYSDGKEDADEYQDNADGAQMLLTRLKTHLKGASHEKG